MTRRSSFVRALAAARIALAVGILSAVVACLLTARGIAADVELARVDAFRLHAETVRESRGLHAATVRRIRASETSLAERVRELDAAYSSILAEQRKKTIDDVYGADEVRARREEGVRLYAAGDYAGAVRALSPVRSLARDDDEAMFCLIAAEFRINPLDSGRYGPVKRALRDLRVGGYRNDELDEIVAYIEGEEHALSAAGAERPLSDAEAESACSLIPEVARE